MNALMKMLDTLSTAAAVEIFCNTKDWAAPSTANLVSGATRVTPDSPGATPQGLTKAEAIQVKVHAVLKKREYGATQSNSITAVIAMTELSEGTALMMTQAFSVFLHSDMEAKALDVWGSYEALNIFQNKRLLLLQGPEKVMVAICINGLNFFFKPLAWVYTGSASMFSEAIHSLADTCNQALLALGISQSVCNPECCSPMWLFQHALHCLLHQRSGHFYDGRGISWYRGTMGLLHPEPIKSLLWAYYINVMQTQNRSTNVVLLEDAAVVLGVILAAGSIGLTSLTGNPTYDSLGSLSIGTLLGTISAFLIYTNTEALLGCSIQVEHVQKLRVCRGQPRCKGHP
uniref:Solute carrier family 30 member 9 n=1 Tax=Amphilophus citrinellus TaxID=61819 RepID=A0A3Q0QU48_AMPCI